MTSTEILRRILELSAELHAAKTRPLLTPKEKANLAFSLADLSGELQHSFLQSEMDSSPEVVQVPEQHVEGCFYTYCKFFAV
jgi:hypothetical protein